MSYHCRAMVTPGTPLIAVSMGSAQGSGPLRATVNAAYLRAIERAGGVPLLIAPQLATGAVDALFSLASGLMLPGGGDLDPGRYGEPPHPAVTGVDPARDELEFSLVRRALDRDMPLLAICRGMQVLNVALGGSLHQDIPSCLAGAMVHAQGEHRDVATHPVTVKRGSCLASVLGQAELQVNSMHHQALNRVAPGLRVVAAAPDGVIEGVELPSARWVLGVQWHPEELAAHSEPDVRLFRRFVEAAEAAATARR